MRMRGGCCGPGTRKTVDLLLSLQQAGGKSGSGGGGMGSGRYGIPSESIRVTS